MNQNISRRDFLDGIAMTIGAAALPAGAFASGAATSTNASLGPPAALEPSLANEGSFESIVVMGDVRFSVAGRGRCPAGTKKRPNRPRL